MDFLRTRISLYEMDLAQPRGHSITTNEGGGEGVKKISVFVHTQGIKTVHGGGGGVKKWQNSVHVVVE